MACDEVAANGWEPHVVSPKRTGRPALRRPLAWVWAVEDKTGEAEVFTLRAIVVIVATEGGCRRAKDFAKRDTNGDRWIW